ncbi:MAG: T9SS type A sorting domain-containing protein [Chitinophagaceae bacterium]
MKPCVLLLSCWCIAVSAWAQSADPGNVKGAFLWYSTDTTGKIPALRSRIAGDTGSLTFSAASVADLNFHPALLLSGKNTLRASLGTRDLRNASYFTVYQGPDTSKEKCIWHITNDQQTTLVLTTDRMADLSAYHYMNYRDVVRDQPKVNIYVQNRESDALTATEQWWNIGTKPSVPELPVADFRGVVPEIIAYDRVLNSRERLQVASYLALKYGITLTEPGATYLNSTAQEVWNGYDYSDWHHNIAGVCRDDAAGLWQQAAGSTNTPGLLTITAKDSLRNNSFLLWGDNGKSLIPADRIAGMPRLLQKTWLMKTFGNVLPFTTDLLLDTKSIDAPLPVQPVYWLVTDSSGKGNFDATARFTRMDHIDQKGRVLFKNISWDKDGSGKDVWVIAVAEELLLATTIHQPACALPRNGAITTKIIGGMAPYQLVLKQKNGLLFIKKITDPSGTVEFTSLQAGKYFLTVTDATLRSYADSFYINNTDAPLVTSLAERYTLPANGALQLDAAGNMPDGLSWEWKGPDNFQSGAARVTITQPGLYTLRCTKDGCSSEQELNVVAAHANILYDVTVYPNPSPAAFTARVTLDKPAPVTMEVYTHDGRLIYSRQGVGRSNYLFTGDLRSSGVYELVFTSGLSRANKRLVIVH